MEVDLRVMVDVEVQVEVEVEVEGGGESRAGSTCSRSTSLASPAALPVLAFRSSSRLLSYAAFKCW